MTNPAPGFMACCIICLLVTWICVPLRGFARLKVISRLALEDYLLLLGQLLFTGTVILGFLEIKDGLGSSWSDPNRPYQVEDFLRHTFIGAIIYTFAMMLIRLSISLLLMRLAINRSQKSIVWLVICIVLLSTSLFVYWTFAACTPYWHFWDRQGTGTCTPVARAYNWAFYVNAGGAILSDWTLAILPMWILYRSRLPRNIKMAMSVILGLGVIASVAVVIRLIESRRVSNSFAEFCNNFGLVLTWSVAEGGLAITAACCATFRTLVMSPRSRDVESDGTRGRGGRPPQPGDTKLDWDPGLTIGFISHTLAEDEGAALRGGHLVMTTENGTEEKRVSRHEVRVVAEV